MNLEIDDVSVFRDERSVIQGVTAAVADGGWLAVIGPNGAGKTTLLRAVVGLVAYRGEIRFDGRVRRARARREDSRLVAYVPQRPLLPLAMTVYDYVLLGRMPHRGPLGGERIQDRAVASSVMERLQLGPFAMRNLGEISGGEAQRALLARALVQQAPVLVMDEPTASLDLGHGQRFLELVDELRAELGLTVVSALHDLQLAALYADQLLLLACGREVAAGGAEEVLCEEHLTGYFGATARVERTEHSVSVVLARERRPPHHLGQPSPGHELPVTVGEVGAPSPRAKAPAKAPGERRP